MSKRLLRSLLSLMVCMAMLLSLAPAALAESADAPSTEMAVGAVIHGFEVVENGEFALLNAKTTVLRHQKTGATVFFLINEDTNRAFDISFVTPLSDDKGIPHVFEHSTLDGSKKYPSASLFFNTDTAPVRPGPGGFVLDVVDTKGDTLIAQIDAQGNITINNPQAAQALNMAAGWIGKITPKGALDYMEEESRAVFQNGDALFMRNWPYAYVLAQDSSSAASFRP